jgi:tetratricopeptide (TPR) repeat protein
MKSIFFKLLIPVFVYAVVSCTWATSYNFKNYDNDPILEKAWEYDREHAPDKTKADRDKAVEYYLKYLERDDLPTFQQAKVYVQMAVQYTTLSSPKEGIMPDPQKAKAYLEKALELEPERIGGTTIRARTLLSSLPVWTDKEKFEKRMEVYGWLLSLNEKKIEKMALPVSPGETELSDLRRLANLNLIKSVKKTTAINTVDIARSMPDREIWLMKIIEAFPDAEIAEMAKQELSVPADKVSDAALESLHDSQVIVNEAGGSGEKSAPSTESKKQNTVAQETNVEQVEATPFPQALNNNRAKDNKVSFYIILTVCVGLFFLGASLFVAKKRKV